MWREEVVERSWQVLQDLRGLASFMVIGGWGIYLWVRKLKSRDIDLYIDQDNFYRLQAELMARNLGVVRNPRLRKFEAKIRDVEIDIYTPFMSNLVIPFHAIREKGWYTSIEQFQVPIPEVLLFLKAQAARERWLSEKGLKDRIDLISLLYYAELKLDLVADILNSSSKARDLIPVMVRTVAESRREYEYLGLRYEREGTLLRKTLEKKLPQL